MDIVAPCFWGVASPPPPTPAAAAATLVAGAVQLPTAGQSRARWDRLGEVAAEGLEFMERETTGL